MKRIILILAVLAIVPIGIFAQTSDLVYADINEPEIAVGPAIFIKSPVLAGQNVDVYNANVNQFAFGGDVRAKYGLFQAEGLLLFSLGAANSVNLFFDAGVAADISIVRFSLAAGPNFAFNLENQTPFQLGFNAKAGIDLNMGQFVGGISYIMAMHVANVTTINTGSGLLGAHILFKL